MPWRVLVYTHAQSEAPPVTHSMIWRDDWGEFAMAWAQGLLGGQPEDARAFIKVGVGAREVGRGEGRGGPEACVAFRMLMGACGCSGAPTRIRCAHLVSDARSSVTSTARSTCTWHAGGWRGERHRCYAWRSCRARATSRASLAPCSASCASNARLAPCTKVRMPTTLLEGECRVRIHHSSPHIASKDHQPTTDLTQYPDT